MLILNRFSKRLTVGLILLLVWFGVHCAAISLDGFADSAVTSGAPADAIVVLGNQVMDAQTPGELLLRRLEKALELYQKGAARHVVCSGGKSSSALYEADVMRDWLVAHGVDSAAIGVDHDGKDTYSTARDTRRIFESEGWHSALIVSQFTHISRCKLAFARFGVTPLHSAHADFTWRDCIALPREFAGFYYYLIRRYAMDGP